MISCLVNLPTYHLGETTAMAAKHNQSHRKGLIQTANILNHGKQSSIYFLIIRLYQTFVHMWRVFDVWWFWNTNSILLESFDTQFNRTNFELMILNYWLFLVPNYTYYPIQKYLTYRKGWRWIIRIFKKIPADMVCALLSTTYTALHSTQHTVHRHLIQCTSATACCHLANTYCQKYKFIQIILELPSLQQLISYYSFGYGFDFGFSLINIWSNVGSPLFFSLLSSVSFS